MEYTATGSYALIFQKSSPTQRCHSDDMYLRLQLIHGDRTMYNARDGSDLARFLADPVREDIDSHLQNLRCSFLRSQIEP